MKRDKVDNIIREFVVFGKQGENCKTSNNSLTLDTGCLVNYHTIIGLKLGGTVIINKDKYSVTTSKNQNKIRNTCKNYQIKTIEVEENVINSIASKFHNSDMSYHVECSLLEELEKIVC